MAPSSPDVSILNSTLRLFTFLDLNNEQQQHHHQQEMQNMEDMDIDQVMEVPDTPDRLVGRKTNGGEGLAKEFSSSVVGDSEPSALMDNGSSNLSRNHFRSFVRHGKNKFSIRDETSRINHTVVSLSDSPSRFPRNSHGRRTMGDQISRKSETRLSTLPHGLDGNTSTIAEVSAVDVKTQDRNKKRVLHRGNTSCDTAKTTYAEVPSISLACKDDDNVVYSSVRSEYTGVPERAYSRGSSKDIPSKEIRKGSIGCSSHTSKASSNVCAEKTPVNVSYTRSGASLGHAILTDFSRESMPKAEQIMLRSPIIPTRTTGQRRLVRNGCISPYNIAQSKQTVVSHANSPEDAGTTSSEIHIVSPNSEENQFVGMDKRKGKGVMIGSSPTKQYDAKTINLSDRRSLNSKEEASGIRAAGEVDFRCSKNIDGWRSAHSRSKITSLDVSDETGHLSGRVDVAGLVPGQNHENRKRNIVRVNGTNTCPETDIPQVRDLVSPQHGPSRPTLLVQGSPSPMFELGPETSRNSGRNKLTKRQRRPSLPRTNLGECSSSGFDDSDITCLWSSQEPASARSTRSRDPHHPGISGPTIEIDESSPEVRCRYPEDTSGPVNGDLEARASQMEADELLARQLQEQFYHEIQGVGAGEIDAGLAWTLQQQENAQLASLGGQHASHRVTRDSAMSHLYRQYPSESIPSSSIRSRTRARGSPFSRTARLRNTSRHSSTIPYRQRNSRFPPNVDIETRIHILEALEAAVGNHNDMPMASHYFQVQRDFNENDYEMLLALDENNHRHVGASAHQINGLPQSTVQTDNFEETCAICLENPTIGETIRHLPCLHKFHKDCIDSWLRRSTACPVCKSSIT